MLVTPVAPPGGHGRRRRRRERHHRAERQSLRSCWRSRRSSRSSPASRPTRASVNATSDVPAPSEVPPGAVRARACRTCRCRCRGCVVRVAEPAGRGGHARVGRAVERRAGAGHRRGRRGGHDRRRRRRERQHRAERAVPTEFEAMRAEVVGRVRRQARQHLRVRHRAAAGAEAEPPLAGARVPKVSLQVPGLVVSKRNQPVVVPPFGLAEPLSVAVVLPTLDASTVSTVGASGRDERPHRPERGARAVLGDRAVVVGRVRRQRRRAPARSSRRWCPRRARSRRWSARACRSRRCTSPDRSCRSGTSRSSSTPLGLAEPFSVAVVVPTLGRRDRW